MPIQQSTHGFEEEVNCNRLLYFMYLESLMIFAFLRFINHLGNCRKKYTGTDIKTCPFNQHHHIPQPEFEYHKQTCDGRAFIEHILESGVFKRPAEAEDEGDHEASKRQKSENPGDDEDDWDNAWDDVGEKFEELK